MAKHERSIKFILYSLRSSLVILSPGVFKADQEAVKNLVEMGFPEGEVVAALEVTRNNQQEACSYLLGN